MARTGLVDSNRIKPAVKYRLIRNPTIWIASIILSCLALPFSVFAVTQISQSYSTTEKLSLGSIVSLVNNSTEQVVAAGSNNVSNLLGVVINAGNSALSLSNGKDNQAEIATSGILQVLVSDINGSISAGDHITASPITGVGMKASTNVRVLGTAQGSLSDANGAQQKYTDDKDVEHSVLIGEIPVLINVSYYFKEPDKTLVPPAIQNIANTLAGKEVSPLPIIISSGIFIVTIVIVAIIIYSMVRSGVISVGRNPMSQSAIYRDIIQLSALVLVILAVGMIAIYLVLTRM